MIELGEKVGHYRVTERLNAGGMGVVYKAYDLLLNRDVALKVLTSSRIDFHRARERFRKEANHLSQLEHTNICAIYDFGWTDDGDPYIVMGLASGESLRERLGRGPLSVTDTYEIAVQTARGLRHAHRRGIVHRDIKPANLMVTTTEDGSIETVKIVDFGIAKGPEVAQDRPLTRVGGIVGTSLYMAPEQRVEGAEVGPQADIWALGHVLHELLTGIVPRPGSSISSSGLRRSSEGRRGPPSPELRKLTSVINRCMEPDPASRFASGAELLDGLTSLRRSPRTQRPLVAALVVLVAALGSLVLPQGREFWRGVLFGTSLPVHYRVAVVPFSSSDPQDDPLAIGLTQYMISAVADYGAGTDAIWVVQFDDIQRNGIATPEEARKQYPVNVVITGDVQRREGGIGLGLEIHDLSGSEPRVSQAAALPLPYDAGFEEAIRDLLGRILRIRGITDTEESQATPQETSPASPYYLLGTGSLNRFFSAEGIETAIEYFQTAISEDSTFAPSYAGLCQAFWALYQRDWETSHADTAREMCDQAVSRTQDDPTALTALGRTQLQTGQPERALETLQRAVFFDSVSAEAQRWLGRVYENLGNSENAERAYGRAIDLQPLIWLYPSELGILYNRFERHEEAIEQHRRVIQLSPDNHFGYIDLGFSFMALNRTEEAVAEFQESITRRPSSLAYRNLGYLYLRNQQDDEAVDALQSSTALDEEDWWSWRWLGHAHHWRGEADQAAVAWRRMTELAEPGLAINPEDRDRLCGLAEAYILLGDHEQGRRYLDQLAALSPRPNYNVYWVGRIYEILGSREAALEYVQQALTNGFDSIAVERDRWLDGLRADPRFQGNS